MPEAPREPLDADVLTQKLFDRIAASDDLPEGIAPRDATESVLAWIGQRISGGEVTDFTERLPPALRRLVRPRALEPGEQPEKFDAKWLLHQVARDLGISMQQAEAVVRRTYLSLRALFPTEEWDHVESQLPRDILQIWQA